MCAQVVQPKFASAFANGMEYFNTYGGCTAAGAAGMATLRVIQEEKFQARAARVGRYLTAKLKQLQQVRRALVHLNMHLKMISGRTWCQLQGVMAVGHGSDAPSEDAGKPVCSVLTGASSEENVSARCKKGPGSGAAQLRSAAIFQSAGLLTT